MVQYDASSIVNILQLIICLDEMIENHQEKENDADDIAEHGQLDIRDHLFAEKFFIWNYNTRIKC